MEDEASAIVLEGENVNQVSEEVHLPNQNDTNKNNISQTNPQIPEIDECSVNNNLNIESENCIIAPVNEDTTSCPVEVSIDVTDQVNSKNNVIMKSDDCAVTSNSHEVTPSPVEDEGATPLLPTDNPTNKSSEGSCNTLSKSRRKVKNGLKRKKSLANKSIQTSIHLASNSTFRDRTVDLDALRRETGVVCVEDLHDLDVSLDEWPMLLVSQLRLRDTIINSLNGTICELVECGHVLEQDLDYLKLKILELQQETKRRAKNQQSHKIQGKETESQTTEEDFTEAWSRWYYGCWGDYYSESDPTSSMYWPGHYMQQATVVSRGNIEKATQQKVDEEQAGCTGKLQEETKSEKHNVKKKKGKEKGSSHGKSEKKGSEKRKKLKGKRTEKHKSAKSNKEQSSEEKNEKKTQNVEKNIKKNEMEEGKGRKKKEESDVTNQITAVPVVSSQPNPTEELNGTKEDEDKPHGWDTSQSITQQVATVAAQAVEDSGYVFQQETGLYYDYNTGYYYNAENGLYYDTKSGTYFYYDHTSQSYQFHSQVSPTTTKNNKRRKRKKTKKKSDKSLDMSEDKEEGECTASDDEGEGDNAEGECEKEEKEEGDTASPNQYEEDAPEKGDIPPSLRLMVVEGGERVRVGELHMVTLDGGTVGREATNDVHLPDLNVSKMHAEIEYRTTGVEDHHYFLRDLGSNNGTFVNNVRLSEARQSSNQVEVGHGWEVQFGPIKVKCHLHPGTLTCNECEPGLVLHPLKLGEAINSFKNAKSKEKARRKELKAMQKKYKLTHPNPQPSSTTGYTDRTLLRQAEKGSDNPYEKTEVASAETPLKKTNRGFALLQKMGWSQGQGLGKDSCGITEPVQPVTVVGQRGLGTSQSSALPIPDPCAERRRKQLQITQERYKQSTVGH